MSNNANAQEAIVRFTYHDGYGYKCDHPGDMSGERCAQAWQEIATAPKDGTRVLLYRPGCSTHIAIGWCHGASSRFADAIGWFNATHWQPLPSPPADQPKETSDE
jgi:hypothetical protein